MKEENEKCTPCEANFERNIRHLVKEGEAPSSEERHEKQEEVKAAFAQEERLHKQEE